MNNNIGSNGVGVSEYVAEEFDFLFNTIQQSCLTKKEKNKLSYLCSNHNNNLDQKSECKYCGEETDDDAKEYDLEQLFTSAAFYGLFLSTGTIANSQLTTDCSRLQKQNQSVASLSFDSYLDIIYTKLKEDSISFLENHESNEDVLNKTCPSNLFSQQTRLDVEKADDSFMSEMLVKYTGNDDSQSYCNNDNNNNKDNNNKERIKEAARKKITQTDLNIPPDCAVFHSNLFESELARVHMSGGSLHAHSFKYKSDSAYISLKNSIDHLPSQDIYRCSCEEDLTEWIKKSGRKDLIYLKPQSENK